LGILIHRGYNLNKYNNAFILADQKEQADLILSSAQSKKIYGILKITSIYSNDF